MASGISVERAGLQSGVQVCKTCIHELQAAASSLQRSYQAAGSGWKDENYFKLGQIVEECITSLQKPIPDIEGSQSTLEAMLGLVDAAEDVF